MTPLEDRLQEVMQLIDNSVMLTDSNNEMLLLACGMLARTIEIFDKVLGVQGRKAMLYHPANDD
jgi:hypothetical protein